MNVEEFFAHLGLYEIIVLCVLLVAFLIQVVYYLFIFIRIPRFKEDRASYSDKQEPVSIVICARNEYDNLTEFLPLVLEQEYPNFEVVVVNDCSDDDSQKLLESFQEKYKHLRVTQIKHDEKFTHGKKLALTIGIKAAKNEWLLLIDADCKPQSKLWLASMQRNFVGNKDIVLGVGGYEAEKGFLNKLIRFDTFFIALQYLSFALIKIPYMGVGRNLAYRKSLFMKNKGFASHAHILSGDDDLFINEVANSKNTTVEFSHDSLTRSVPKRTFQFWMAQKTRHLSTGHKYRFVHKLMLGGELFSRFFVYLAILLLTINPTTWFVGVGVLVIRWIIQISVLNGALRRLNEKRLLPYAILFDIVIPLINLFLYLVHTINAKQNKWK